MKRTLIILLIVLLIGTNVSAASGTNAPVEIASREDLLKIADDPSGSYVLTADVDLGGAAWTPIPFYGTLDGGGHSILNLTVNGTGAETTETYDGNRRTFDTVFAGLFSVMKGASVSNLNLVNVEILVETDQNCFVGAIAGYASDSGITDCTVSLRGKLVPSATQAGIAGLVGFVENCDARDCAVEAELILADANRDVLCEEFLGGVFGAGYGSVYQCAVRLRGFADIYGYAHNGGVFGMVKMPYRLRYSSCYLRDTRVDAEISFFEIAPARRAYCKAFVGEDAAGACHLSNNTEEHFVRNESRTADPVRPEQCEAPSYRAEVTDPTCSEFGYTTYTCEQCGYSYRDDYVLPRHDYETTEVRPTCTQEGRIDYVCRYCGDAYSEPVPAAGHVPGEWTVSRPATYTEEGEEELRCTVCGALLETRAIPAEGPVVARQILLSETAIAMEKNETCILIATIEPEQAADRTVRFESSDPGVVTVDQSGYLNAVGPGTATITVTSGDGFAQATCSVTVTERTPEPEPEEDDGSSSSSFLLRCF